MMTNQPGRSNRMAAILKQFILISMLLAAASSQATQLVWDPLGNNSGATTGASGNWDTTAGHTNWWNGTTDVAWTQAATTGGTNVAIFGGSDGTWFVTNDVSQVTCSNLTIYNSGYTFYSNPIDLAGPACLYLAAGKAATFYCNMASDNSAKEYILSNNSVLNFCGNIPSSQPKLIGPSSSAFYLGGAADGPGVIYILGPVYLTNGLSPPAPVFLLVMTRRSEEPLIPPGR